MHSTGTGQPVETQDVFFWRLAGRSAPTGLAIVHWIGCINAIKYETHNWGYPLKENENNKNLSQFCFKGTQRPKIVNEQEFSEKKSRK